VAGPEPAVGQREPGDSGATRWSGRCRAIDAKTAGPQRGGGGGCPRDPPAGVDS
jgi:hypothetical protein